MGSAAQKYSQGGQEVALGSKDQEGMIGEDVFTTLQKKASYTSFLRRFLDFKTKKQNTKPKPKNPTKKSSKPKSKPKKNRYQTQTQNPKKLKRNRLVKTEYYLSKMGKK